MENIVSINCGFYPFLKNINDTLASSCPVIFFRALDQAYDLSSRFKVENIFREYLIVIQRSPAFITIII